MEKFENKDTINMKSNNNKLNTNIMMNNSNNLNDRPINRNIKPMIEYLKQSIDNLSNKMDLFINKPTDKLTEAEHYITISGGDRHWINESLTSKVQNRYKFRVNLNASSGSTSTSLGISSNFKQIVSIELINAILPIDPITIGQDNRICLDVLQYPYILLKIKEIQDVYNGTNPNLTDIFTQLVFDKEYNVQVISDDYINNSSDRTSNNDNIINATSSAATELPRTKYPKQYLRGFYKYIPSFTEKKTYYRNPISSLTSLSIDITNPYGNHINNPNGSYDLYNTNRDVLNITAITTHGGSALTNVEIASCDGYPFEENTNTNNGFLKIETTEFFSNRHFRIGDLIVIKGVVETLEDLLTGEKMDPDFLIDFINRKEGHYIINLQNETIDDTSTGSLTNDGNKSFIKFIYIGMPGQFDPLSGTVPSESRVPGFNGSPGFDDARLINMSLQTSLTFKIKTLINK